MTLQEEIENLKGQIEELTKIASCKSCGKTLFKHDDNYIYIKCKHCKEVNQFKK